MTTVRFEQPADHQAVREINEQAFGSPLEADLVDRLRGQSGVISLVATMNGPSQAVSTVVGHVLFTPVTIEPATDLHLSGLGPMAVRPTHQRSGVGRRLVEAGLDACRTRGISAVVVVGHPEYYPRFGFEPAHTWGLTLPQFDVPPDVFMAVLLGPSVRERIKGAVRYRPEFAELE